MAKIRNQYYQEPHLTQDTTRESDKITIWHHKQEPRGQPFPSRWPQGSNEQTRKHDKHNTLITQDDPHKKYRLGTISKKYFTEPLSEIVKQFLKSEKGKVTISTPIVLSRSSPLRLFFLFPKLKKILFCWQHTCSWALDSAFSQCLRGKPKFGYRDAFQKWSSSLKLCI